ncbi:MAG: LysR family transcriptional regulator [Pseudomonadota bacterium]|nr:LysR family transcriptional regulator [Pseudomonadota bacterium]
MRKLPSIKLLVTFEAAARHLSFKDAADELFVSPSAVSHQIRTLETALNTSLFARSNRSIELTREGHAYFQEISQAIRTIHRATESLMSESGERSLLISCIPYLTNTYLVPNLKSFKTLYPNLKISMESRIERSKLNAPHWQDLQVGVRHGKEDNNGLYYEEISPVKISPVCSPDCSLEQPLTKLEFSADSFSWQKWQSDWAMEIEFKDSLSCDGMQAVEDMAQQGLGIAMGYFPFMSTKVSGGDLILPYPSKMSDLDSLYLVYPEKDRGDPILVTLSSWLKEILSLHSV